MGWELRMRLAEGRQLAIPLEELLQRSLAIDANPMLTHLGRLRAQVQLWKSSVNLSENEVADMRKGLLLDDDGEIFPFK